MLVATHCNQPFLSGISHFPVPSPEPLSEMRTRCETLLQTAQNTISRDFTLRFAELESTL